MAAGQLVSVAAGSARVRSCWRSCGSVAAGAARDGGCWSTLVLLRRKAVAAGAARFSGCWCSARLRLQVQLLSFAALGRGRAARQFGLVAAGTARDGRRWSSSDQVLRIQRETKAAGAARIRCHAWSSSAGAARVRSGSRRRLPEQLSATLRLPEHISVSCCLCGTKRMLQERLSSAVARF